jgi:hypothetical protein
MPEDRFGGKFAASPRVRSDPNFNYSAIIEVGPPSGRELPSPFGIFAANCSQGEA